MYTNGREKAKQPQITQIKSYREVDTNLDRVLPQLIAHLVTISYLLGSVSLYDEFDVFRVLFAVTLFICVASAVVLSSFVSIRG